MHEYGIGDGGEYCGDNDAQLDRIKSVKLILSPKQRAKPAASRTRTCTNAAVCIASGECPSRF